MRELVSWRLQSSDATQWMVYLGAKTLESSLEGVPLEKSARYDYWIQKYEQEVYSTPTWVLTNDQLQDRLRRALEVRLI